MTRPRLHAITWFVWAIAAAASVQLAPNPVYVALVIAASAVVVEAHGGNRPLRKAFPYLVGLGVVFAALRVLLTALTTHTGIGTLLELPEATLPPLLGGFTLGGSVDAAVIARAAAEGFAVVGIMAAFGAFNAVVAHDELVRSAPRAFHEVGLVVTVALAFVPATIQTVAAVREADRARTGGRVVRRGRLLRQILPLLETGLERAVHLAESMDSRGFGHLPARRSETASAWLSGAGLLACAGAFLALVGRGRTMAGALLLLGCALIAIAVWTGSRAQAPVRYRPRRLARADRLLLAWSLLPPAVIAVAAAMGDSSLVWPAGSLRLPQPNLVLVAAVAALAAPAVVRPTAPVAAPEPPAKADAP